MIIDIKTIIDYSQCTLLCRYKLNGVYTPHTNLLDKYDSDMHKFASAYNLLLMDNQDINYKDVKKIFGSLWMGSKNKNKILFATTGDWRDTFNNKRKDGINSTLKYHDYTVEYPYIPIAVNYKYSVNITNNLTLTGTIDLIKQVDEDKIEIVNYNAHSRRAMEYSIVNDIEVMAMVYAFRKEFNQIEDGCSIYCFDKNREYSVSHTDKCLETFRKSIINIAKAVHNNIYYYAPTYKCKQCIYKDCCSKNTAYLNLK